MREILLVGLFVLTFPGVAYVSTLPPQRFQNEITKWGDRNSQVYADFINAREKFGANDWVVFSWPGCHLNDPRLEAVTQKIETQLGGQVQQVSNGRRVLNQLQQRAKLSQTQAIERLKHVFLSASGRDTGVGFRISPSARNDRGEIIDVLDSVLVSSGIDPQTAMFAGLGHNLYWLDKEGLESPFRMVPQIMLLALVLTVIFVRNFWLAFFINALGTYTGCLSFNFIHLADVDLNAILWPLPTLTMLLTISASMHYLSYFKKASQAKAHGPMAVSGAEVAYRRAVARKSLALAVKPTLCCTATTAIGLVSLLLSTSEPVRQFGIFGAMSIAAAGLLVLVWLPPFLTLVGHAEKGIASPDILTKRLKTGDFWTTWARFTNRFRWPIVVICCVILMASAWGVPYVKTGSNLENFFPPGHRVIEQATAVEERVGPLGAIELLLEFESAQTRNDRSRIKAIEVLCSRICQQEEIAACVSAATFAPQDLHAKVSGTRPAIERTKWVRFKREMISAGFVHVDPETTRQTWRVSCRYRLTQSIDIAKVSVKLRSMANEVLQPSGRSVFPEEALTVSATGEFVLFDRIDRQFFRELLLTYVAAFGVISLMVFCVLKNFRASLIALLPNLFPAVVVLGAAGFLARSLDVASLMTASVALGIAVDDTMHFLLWKHRSEKNDNSSSRDREGPALEDRMRYCGLAMVQTSVILGCSIGLYAFCGFLPTVRFGILLSAMMFAALVGDLLFLPALLHCFGSEKRRPVETNGTQQV